MTFTRYFLVLITFLAGTSPFYVSAQNSSEPSVHHDHAIYQKIEKAYQKGTLTLDQKVLYKFYANSSPDKLPMEFRPAKESIQKCGTPAISDFYKNRAKLARSTVSEVESMMESNRIQSSQTYQSPSGKFTIYYETSGPNAVPSGDQDRDGIPDYVEEVAQAADSTYRHEVQRLGYTDPIPSGETYDIEILDKPCGTIECYGQTVSNGTNTFIQIENDFEGFPPNDDPEGDQIGAVKVTIAHEFKHAIHYAANKWQGETANWLEMDATMMEEVVYDNVNDYYNYLQSSESIFNNPSNSFYPGSYYHVTWALYFDQRYGPEFWVNVWKTIKDNPFITMIEAMTRQLGGPEAFNDDFIASHLWHYASGPGNASEDFGFRESQNYPSPPIQTEKGFYNRNFTIPRSAPADALKSFSAQYYSVPVPNNIEGGVSLDINSKAPNEGIGLIAYYKDGSTESSVISSYNSQGAIRMSKLNWRNIDRLGLILTNSSTNTSGSDQPIIVGIGSNNFNSTLSQNYPNPFNPQTRIRFTLEQASQVQLKVYDSAGRLVQTLIDGELNAGLHEPVFDGSGLASGIYFYQLKTNRQTFVKKMTLVK